MFVLEVDSFRLDIFNSDEADCHVTSANWYVPMREMHMLH